MRIHPVLGRSSHDHEPQVGELLVGGRGVLDASVTVTLHLAVSGIAVSIHGHKSVTPSGLRHIDAVVTLAAGLALEIDSHLLARSRHLKRNGVEAVVLGTV